MDINYYTFFNRSTNPDYDYFRGAWKLDFNIYKEKDK